MQPQPPPLALAPVLALVLEAQACVLAHYRIRELDRRGLIGSITLCLIARPGQAQNGPSQGEGWNSRLQGGLRCLLLVL